MSPPQKVAAKPTIQPLNGQNADELSRQAGEVVVTVSGVHIEVSPELEAAVRRAIHGSLAVQPTEMTTNQAAEFLDVSRPFVIKLIKRGELPCRMVGTHRRIPYAALLEYREKMFQQARKACDEMTQLSQNLGLYESAETLGKTQ